MKIKTIIVVLGNKMPEGVIDRELVERCDIALAWGIENCQPSTWAIVLTGGVTTHGKPAEADIAEEYLRGHMQDKSPDVPMSLFCERYSKTTPENILGTLELLRGENITPEKVVIVGRKSQIPKVRIIVQKLWDLGNPAFEFISGIDLTPWWYQLIDCTVMCVLSWFDPCGRSLILLKRISRNA